MASASDSFDRADAGTLGSNWTSQPVSPAETMEIVGNAASCAPAEYASDYWSESVNNFGDAQFSRIVVGSSIETLDDDVGVFATVRAQSGADTCYRLSATGITGRFIELIERTAGVDTILDTYTGGAVVAGDVVELSIDASGNLVGKLNGVEVVSANDTSITGGQPGVAGKPGNLQGTIASWEGGDLGTIEQEGFRWRNDDGDEDAATWKANQDTNMSGAVSTNTRLRVLVNTDGDFGAASYRLEYRKSTDTNYIPISSGNAHPIVGSSANTNGTTLAGGVSLTMPSGIEANDLLLVWGANDNTGGTNMSISGWTNLFHTQFTGNVVSHGAWAKIASGGDTATLAGASQDYSATVVRIPKNYHGVTSIGSDIKVGTAATGTSVNPNSPSLDAGSSSQWLWFASFGADDDDNTTGWAPSSYTELALVESAQSTTSCMLGVSYRQNTTQTEDPGNAVMAASEEWIAQTIAIPPKTAAIVLSASANIAASGEATTAQLTAPSGKSTSDFDAGRIQDDENPADAVTISDTDYTELEWCLSAVNGVAVNSDVYQFRVTTNGSAFNTYTVTPQWTIASGALSLTADAASFTETGVAAGTKLGRQTAGGIGAFTLTGQDVQLVGPGGSIVMTATATSYAETGVAAGLKRSFPLVATTRTYTHTGQTNILAHNHVVIGGTGVFVEETFATGPTFLFTGNAASLFVNQGVVMPATVRTYALTGNVAPTQVERLLISDVRTYALTGVANAFLYNQKMSVTPVSIVWTRVGASLRYSEESVSHGTRNRCRTRSRS